MARIKIQNLPEDMKVSKEEMRKVFGGIYTRQRTTVKPIGIYGEDDDCDLEIEYYFLPSEGGKGC